MALHNIRPGRQVHFRFFGQTLLESLVFVEGAAEEEWKDLALHTIWVVRVSLESSNRTGIFSTPYSTSVRFRRDPGRLRSLRVLSSGLCNLGIELNIQQERVIQVASISSPRQG